MVVCYTDEPLGYIPSSLDKRVPLQFVSYCVTRVHEHLNKSAFVREDAL
jgi:hypothetical protein